MRKLIVMTFSTLDGVMQAGGGPDEDTEGGFVHGGWQTPFFDDDNDVVPDMLRRTGALLIGRKTYDIFAAYWPRAGHDVERLDTAEFSYADFMNSIPKYVASLSDRALEWQNCTLLKGDVVEAVRRLKGEEGKDILVFGSSNFAQTLMQAGLIDEYVLLLFPLTLGSGKHRFQAGGPMQTLRLLNATTSKMGVVALTYTVEH